MKYFLRKEISFYFSSVAGYVILGAWLLSILLMLWVFGGAYNIPEGGYATMRPFFSLLPMVSLVFAPAVTMHLLADEKRSGTLELLLFRPVRLPVVVFSKYLAALFPAWVMLLLSLVSAFSVDAMSSAGLDWGELAGGYAGAACMFLALMSIGLLASSLTSSQLVAFLLAAFLSFSLFYGADLAASLFSDGSSYHFVRRLGMNAHYSSLARGVIDSRDVLYFLALAAAFFLFTCVALSYRRVRYHGMCRAFVGLALLIALNLFSSFAYVRWDLTADRRYTLSAQTRQLVAGLESPLQVVMYLSGDLNPAFEQLRIAVLDLLEELSQYAGKGILLYERNPSLATDDPARQANYLRMEAAGMKGISVNERDGEGKVSSQIVFPWMQLVYAGDTVPVNLLNRNISFTSAEAIHASVGELEYNFADALRLLALKEPGRIAFIEGHGEWAEPYVYEATELLSKYYQVDRGRLGGGWEMLSPYEVLIIASPKMPFSEAEKMELDQYLMQGGSLFFLLDGIVISDEEFAATGESPTLKNEVNLDDLLFAYGIRVNPVTVMDMDCTPIRLVSSRQGAQDAYVTLPWFFSPLLKPSDNHPISRYLSPLKSELVSTISWIGDGEGQKRTVLLSTSSHARRLPVPEMVSLRYAEMPADAAFFNESDLPVAGLIEGCFPSAFRYRFGKGRILTESQPARLLVCASSSVIKNDWRNRRDGSVPLPLGYDEATGTQLGNADFLVNAVNYLAGNGQWLDLRTRGVQLRLLDKVEVTVRLSRWQTLNILLPMVLLLVGGLLFSCLRKMRCRKWHG